KTLKAQKGELIDTDKWPNKQTNASFGNNFCLLQLRRAIFKSQQNYQRQPNWISLTIIIVLINANMLHSCPCYWYSSDSFKASIYSQFLKDYSHKATLVDAKDGRIKRGSASSDTANINVHSQYDNDTHTVESKTG
ncbi:hypothetical protein STEG23_017781, partial [Scotinomys teguina]